MPRLSPVPTRFLWLAASFVLVHGRLEAWQ
jgi:hypothetical protein